MIVRNSKLIAAPVESVWAATIQFDLWPTWTPTVDVITRLDDGPLAVGSMFRIKQPRTPEAVWRVTGLRQGASFTWETRVLGINMVATHDLSARDAATESTLSLEVSGLGVYFFIRPVIRRTAAKNLELENEGLKVYCERHKS